MAVISSPSIHLTSEKAQEYTRNVQEELKTLASAAQGARSSWRVVCYKQGNSFVANCESHWLQWVWHIFVELFDWFDAAYKPDNEKTMSYFNKVFGEKRIERWDDKYKLYYKFKQEEKLDLTKNYVKQLFSALSCVTNQDIEDFITSISSQIRIQENTLHIPSEDQHCREVLYLSKEHTYELIKYFAQKMDQVKASNNNTARHLTIEDFSDQELDFFYNILKPFSFEVASLYSGENRETGNDRGYTVDGLLRLAGKIEEIQKVYQFTPGSGEEGSHRVSPSRQLLSPSVSTSREGTPEEREEMRQIKTEVSIGKKIVGYYNPDGTMIRTHEGWYYVERKLNSAGMYMVYLRAVNRQNADRLYFLHTQSFGFIPWKWQPLREIFTRDSGQKSIRQADNLREVVEPRVSEDSYKLKIFGYSLGAAGARRFMADCLARHQRSFVTQLMTFSGLGIDRDTSEWIDQKLDGRARSGHIRPEVIDIRNFGDRVSDMGESTPMPDELMYLCNGAQELARCERDPKMLRQSYYNMWRVLFEIYRSINVPHCQEVNQNTKKYHLVKERDEAAIRSLIDNSNPNFESQRQWLAKWFSSKERFKDYLVEQEEQRSSMPASRAGEAVFVPFVPASLPLMA